MAVALKFTPLSDPMVVVYIQERDGAFTEVFRTEVVLNSLNPKWITKYTITYQFEIVQTLLFRVFDVDTQFHNVAVKMLKLEEQQYLDCQQSKHVINLGSCTKGRICPINLFPTPWKAYRAC
ncbi:hypothetical protein V6N11_026052 [Hibiscus sabdariffa]|uniref:C2 domain-containing protein n=1 Tax=Hibiscus sabdariffa TaxID=183260 RepID=A0ABR2SUJ5_9ROSI